jgi:hypothetical protein
MACSTRCKTFLFYRSYENESFPCLCFCALRLYSTDLHSSLQQDYYFAIIVSMSHYIGDGHSFYALHNMLLGGSRTSIRPLQIERILETDNLQKELLGAKESSIASTTGFIVCAIRGILKGALGLSKMSCRMFLIDEERIARIKKAEKGAHDFVSTNDVVASWFLTDKNYRYGWMSLNFRGKIEGHDDHLVGN